MRARASSTEPSQVCVSVVIPTRNRPQFVVKAVASALEQDFASLEVIVVMGGEDRQTSLVLRAIPDARLKVMDLAVNMGGAEARNTGVRAARGDWIAFLDDDDEWLPHKLSRQMVAARQSAALWPVLSSRMIVRRPSYDSIGPLRSYDSAKPLSEFLFCRKPLRDGPYAMQTSTLMMRREMMLAVPFRHGLKRHQDWDWLLRAERVPGVEFRVVNEPLAIYRTGDGRKTLGSAQDWEFSMHWGAEMRGFFSAKAYAWFLATECASRAVKSRAGLKTYAEILRRFVFDGRPSVGSATVMASFLGLPRAWRERALLRANARSRRDQALPVARQKAVQTTLRMEL